MMAILSARELGNGEPGRGPRVSALVSAIGSSVGTSGRSGSEDPPCPLDQPFDLVLVSPVLLLGDQQLALVRDADSPPRLPVLRRRGWRRFGPGVACPRCAGGRRCQAWWRHDA